MNCNLIIQASGTRCSMNWNHCFIITGILLYYWLQVVDSLKVNNPNMPTFYIFKQILVVTVVTAFVAVLVVARFDQSCTLTIIYTQKQTWPPPSSKELKKKYVLPRHDNTLKLRIVYNNHIILG